MSTLLFVALAERTQAGGYRASFPDVPDCVAEGGDLAELLAKARASLGGRLRELAEAGEAWPNPSSFEALTIEPGLIPVLVDVAVDDRPIRVNISLGERLVARLDAAAESRGMTRSGFIAQAVRVSLGERGATVDFDAGTRRLMDELRALGRRVNESLGPESAFSRRMADLDDQLVEGVRKAADSVSAAMTRQREARQSARPSGRRSSVAANLTPSQRDEFRLPQMTSIKHQGLVGRARRRKNGISNRGRSARDPRQCELCRSVLR